VLLSGAKFPISSNRGGEIMLILSPACSLDFPSFVYQFRWRPWAWSEVYATQPELLQYFKTVAKENDFYNKYIKLKHDVARASWSHDTRKWTLVIRDLANSTEFHDTVDLFVHLRGAVCKPKPLTYPGLENFAGRIVHPAEWPDGLDMKDKAVAVIGHGCASSSTWGEHC
jgi:cation diffusion facilitator CzcD-associated flavoprotein CzcO